MQRIIARCVRPILDKFDAETFVWAAVESTDKSFHHGPGKQFEIRDARQNFRFNEALLGNVVGRFQRIDPFTKVLI